MVAKIPYAGFSTSRIQHDLRAHTHDLTQSIEKISSGKRINRASDDIARLSAASIMNTRARSYGMAARNTQDDISLLQTMDSMLGEDQTILQRMYELTVQASNGGLSSNDRSAIQNEITQLQAEFTRVGESAELNNIKLFDGNLVAKFQVGDGSDADSHYTFTFDDQITSESFPPVDGSVTVEATVNNFVNEVGDTVSLDLCGVTVSYQGAGTADQAQNALNLEAALNSQNAALSAQGITFTRSGNDINLQKTNVAGSGLSIIVDNIVNTDNSPSVDYTTATLDSFNIPSGSTAILEVEGVDVSFTGAGTNQANNANAILSALNGVSGTLSALGVTYSQSGSDIIINKSDSTTPNALNSLSLKLKSAQAASLVATADTGSTGATGTVGESITLSNGAVAAVSNFQNESGETIEFSLEGQPLSFTAGANSSSNATAMANAITAAGITDVLVDADSGIVYISKTDGSDVDISNYSGSDADVSSFDVATSGSYSSGSSTGTVQEGPKFILATFDNTASETISMDIEGVAISFTAAGSGNDTANATNLESSLSAASTALSAAGVQWKRDGGNIILSKSGKSSNIVVNNYMSSGTKTSSMNVTHGGSTGGSNSSATEVLSDGKFINVYSMKNTAGETVSFKLGGVPLSFTAAGTGNDAANATALKNALDAVSGSLTNYSWSIESGNKVKINVNGSTDSAENIAITDYSETGENPSWMNVEQPSGSYSTSGDAVIQEGFSLDLGGSGLFENVSGETISFQLAGSNFSFVGAGTGNDSTNASRLYDTLNAQSVALASNGLYLEYNSGDTSVLLKNTTNQAVSFSTYASTDSSESKLRVSESEGVEGTNQFSDLTETTDVTLSNFGNTDGETISFNLNGVPISFEAEGTADQATNTSRLSTAITNNWGALTAAGLTEVTTNASSIQLKSRSGSTISVTSFNSTSSYSYMSMTEPSYNSTSSSTVSDNHVYYSSSPSNSEYPNTSATFNSDYSNGSTYYENDDTSATAIPNASQLSPTVTFTGVNNVTLNDMTAGLTITSTGNSVGSGTLVEGDNLRIRDSTIGVVADAIVDTQANSQWSISILDNALEKLSEKRSHVGSTLNRLQTSLSFARERTATMEQSRSVLEDADIAAEVVEQTRAQISVQAVSSLLSQVKSLPPMILKLLNPS